MGEARAGVDQRKIWRHFHGHAGRFKDAEPRLRFLAKEIERKRSGAAVRVLNIGIGAGYLERLGVSAGWNTFSLDPDRVALARLADEGFGASAGYVQEMPYGPRSFDFVVASELLEHLDAPTRRAALGEVRRVLHEDGWLLGTVPYDEDLSAQETVCPDCGAIFHRWGHQATFDRESLARRLDSAFTLEEMKVTGFPARDAGGVYGWVKRWAPLRLLLLRLGEPISVPTLYFAARPRRRDGRQEVRSD